MNVMNIPWLEVLYITKSFHKVIILMGFILWKVSSEDEDDMASFTYLNKKLQRCINIIKTNALV